MSKRSWPLNGRLINKSSRPVLVWSDDTGRYNIGPNRESDRFRDDVDFVRDRIGTWIKIGPYTCTIGFDGRASRFDRAASSDEVWAILNDGRGPY